MPGKTELNVAVSVALGLSGFLAMPALAQDEETLYDEELILEEVIVTGTRIVTKDGNGRTSPVTVIGQEEIESFGYTRVEEFLNDMPQIDPAQNSFVSLNSSGTATVDLRGLGAKRNLVLLNGHRMQPGGVWSYAPDINQIPAQMIERVEVLTGGASATYGADAVAGVINFIMRRVHGVEVSAGISGYQHKNSNSYIQGPADELGYDYPTGSTGLDGKTYNASIVIGGDFADGRGNMTAYATWRENEALLWGNRDYSSCAVDRTGTRCGTNITATEVPNFYIAPLTEDGSGPYGFDYSQSAFLALRPDSSLMVEDWRNPSNLYNYAAIYYYMRPDERWSLGAFANYEINEHAVVYLETMGFSDKTTAQIAESGTFMLEPYPLHISNAYFPENFRRSLEELWPDAQDFGVYIGKRNTEGGPRQSHMIHSSFRIVTGLRGSISKDWDYDVSYLHANTTSTSASGNDFFAPRVAIAVDSRLCESEPGCIPYEVFTYQGVTAEAAAGVSGTAIANASTSTAVLQAYVTGTTPWGLPAGNVMAVAGYEHRLVEYDIVPDTVYEEGLLTGGRARESLQGGYSVDELFLETNIPLLADEPFARNMTLDLAYRWSDYSTSGPSSTYRAGLDWQVVDWLRFRTGFNHAVRTPNISELYEPQRLGGIVMTDPCAGEIPEYSFEQCARSGVTAEQYGNIPPTPNDGFFYLNGLFGGNPELDPEEADTLTVGLVFEIGESMQLSLDYWDVQIEGAIETLEPAIALDQCLLYDRLCGLVHRAPGSGMLWRSHEGYVYGISWNLGELHYRGIDVAWDWSPGVNWQIGLVGSYYLKKETTTIPGDPGTTQDCAGLAITSEIGDWRLWCNATPEWRHIATVTYDSEGSWTLTGRWRYFGGVTYAGTVDQLADKALEAQSYFDLNAVFRFAETHDVIVGVNNVLDEEPPMVGGPLSDNGNAPGLYDQLGRYLFANVTLRW